MKAFSDFGLIYRRNLVASMRNPVWLLFGLFQPIVYLLLFAPLLGGLGGIPGFPKGSAFTVFTPGLLVMVAMFSTAFAGFGLIDQIRNGIVERLLVTPTNRSSILLGYVSRDLTVLLVQSVVVLAISVPLGLSANIGGIAIALLIMMLSGTFMACSSYALALRLKSEESLSSLLNTIATPLMLLSGVFLPLTLAPKIIQTLASVNPFSYEVNAARSLFLGNFGSSAIVVSAVFLGSLVILSFAWAARSFKRGVSEG